MGPHKIDGNSPAYPQSFASDNTGCMYTSAEKNWENGGMTIRTELAARAMQGMLVNAPFNTTDLELISELAVKYADALIEELNKEKS